MKLFFIKKYSFQRVAILSIAVIVFQLLSAYYDAEDDMEHIDMSVLNEHRIIIDPGHGGIDSGASRNQIIEKEITLAIGTKLAGFLEKNGAIVTVTRKEDIDFYTKGKGGKRNDLLHRIKMIEDSGAEIFISIHCNTFPDTSLSGAQVFYNPKLVENKIVAERLQKALKEFPPNNKRQAKEDSRILLLNGTTIPGVLIETGYISNPKEALLLIDDQYQEKLVEQISKALAYHFSQSVTR